MDAREAWAGTCTARFIPWLVGATALIVLALMVIVGRAEPPQPAWASWVLAGAGIAVVASALIVGRVRVAVTETGIEIDYGSFGWPVQRFPWSDLTAVTAIDVRPTEWGGWGYRWVPWKRGTAAVMRAGAGLRLDRVGGRVFVVTVDGADAAAMAARPFLRH